MPFADIGDQSPYEDGLWAPRPPHTLHVVVHYHVPGEVLVSVANHGRVVLGQALPADLAPLLPTWRRRHGRAQPGDETPADD